MTKEKQDNLAKKRAEVERLTEEKQAIARRARENSALKKSHISEHDALELEQAMIDLDSEDLDNDWGNDDSVVSDAMDEALTQREEALTQRQGSSCSGLCRSSRQGLGKEVSGHVIHPFLALQHVQLVSKHRISRRLKCQV